MAVHSFAVHKVLKIVEDMRELSKHFHKWANRFNDRECDLVKTCVEDWRKTMSSLDLSPLTMLASLLNLNDIINRLYYSFPRSDESNILYREATVKLTVVIDDVKHLAVRDQ